MWLLSRTYLDGYKRSNLFKKKNAQFNFPKKKKKSCYLPFQVVEEHTFDILLYVIVT